MRSEPRVALGAVALALLSALFFTSTYVLNRAAALDGGHWAWTAALRYLWTVPLMLPLMRGRWAPLWSAMRAHPGAWLLWSGIGFVLFYVLLSYAAASGPSWLVAGTFQLTVIAGMLCAPFLYRDARARIPLPALLAGVVVICGVLLMQVGYGGGKLDREAWIALVAVAISAFAYPLGNRGLLLHLERAGIELNATQRVFGMTLASQPFWLVVAAYAGAVAGVPAPSQVLLAAGVALCSGTIATILFFHATAMVRDDPRALGAVEAMQAAELIFSTMLGIAFLGEHMPSGWAAVGALLVIAGIVFIGVLVGRRSAGDGRATRALRTDRGA